MAQTDRANAAVFGDRQHDPALGIREIDEQGFRAKLLHVANEVEDHGDRAQGEEQAAGPRVLAQSVPNAVLLRHFEIEFPKTKPVDGRRIDDEVRPIERRATVGRVLDRDAGPRLFVQELQAGAAWTATRQATAD